MQGRFPQIREKKINILRDKITLEKYIQARRKHFRIEGAKNKYKINQYKTED